jgi:hypothetical protein
VIEYQLNLDLSITADPDRIVVEFKPVNIGSPNRIPVKFKPVNTDGFDRIVVELKPANTNGPDRIVVKLKPVNTDVLIDYQLNLNLSIQTVLIE